MPPIYYINLDRCTERNQQMVSHLERLGLDGAATRISGADGKHRPSLLKHLIMPEETKNTDCELACTTSHIVAIRQAYASGCEMAFMVEDDFILEHLVRRKEEFWKIVKRLPADWDILQLSTSNIEVLRKMVKLPSTTMYVPWTPHHWSTGMY